VPLHSACDQGTHGSERAVLPRPPARCWESPAPPFRIDRALAAAHGHRARRPATVDGELVVCTTHGRPHDETPKGRSRASPWAELRQLDKRVLFIPAPTSRPGGQRATTPTGRRHTSAEFGSHVRRSRALPGVFLNFDIKQTAPVVSLRGGAGVAARRVGRVDGVHRRLVPRPATRRSPRSTRCRHLGGTSPPRILAGRQRGGRCRSSGSALQVPSTSVTLVVEEVRHAAHGRAWRCTLDDQRRRSMGRLATSGRGIISTAERARGGAAERGRNWRPGGSPGAEGLG